MGTSKKRGGSKAHRNRVQTRNDRIKTEQNIMQKLLNESMKKQIEELKKKQITESGSTTNTD